MDTQHFDMKEVARAEKAASKPGKKSRRSKVKEALAKKAAEDTFAMDVADPRFAAVFDSPQFAIDPSNPQYAVILATREPRCLYSHPTHRVRTTASPRPRA